jgi:hypothetical protein
MPTISTVIQRISRQSRNYSIKLHTPPGAAPRGKFDFGTILGTQPRAIGVARKKGVGGDPSPLPLSQIPFKNIWGTREGRNRPVSADTKQMILSQPSIL